MPEPEGQQEAKKEGNWPRISYCCVGKKIKGNSPRASLSANSKGSSLAARPKEVQSISKTETKLEVASKAEGATEHY